MSENSINYLQQRVVTLNLANEKSNWWREPIDVAYTIIALAKFLKL
jgi:hypothetical protein